MKEEDLFREPEGYTDEMQKRDFDEVMLEVEAEGGPKPDPKGFKRLWEKLVDEHEKGGARG